MRRCLQLARYGKGFTAPNPMVGAVIVHKGKIIGEGYHRVYGEPHAEVNAIRSVKDRNLLRESTLYVNLEPCSHYGKTPPCTALIIENRIPRVIIGHLDPYPEVAGKGILQLENAGVKVMCDFLKAECEEVNKRFLTYYQKKRPYIILKWAQSADNFIDRNRESGSGEEAVHFSNYLTRMIVHKARAEEAAIMVGTRTALLDNPSLNVRYWKGKNPLRIALDKNGVIPDTFHLYDGTSPTLLYIAEKKMKKEGLSCQVINFDADVLSQIMNDLFMRKIQSLIVEGGAVLLSHFFNRGLWDEAHVEISPVLLGNGIPAPISSFSGYLSNVKRCKQSVLLTYNNIVIP